MNYFILTSAIFLGFIMGYVYRWRGVPFVGKWKTPFIGTRNEFSIGISMGKNLDGLHNNIAMVLSRHDVNDVKANFVADPFILSKKNKWYMFMEVHNKSRNTGEIGLAISDDGMKWSYESIVLKESFHLSYPYVFEHNNEIWMIPETAKDNSVRLYRCTDFPYTWELEKKILEGKPYVDPSIFKHNGLWWMFVTCNSSRDLILYFATDPMEHWQMHPCSPVVYDQAQKARCAGRVVSINEKLIRFAQDCKQEYGKSVTAYSIDVLDKINFKESPMGKAPILYSSGKEWRAKGMHHIDLHEQVDGTYLAAVDGWRSVKDFGIKY